MSALWPYIAAAGAAILALIGVYVKGQSAGSTKERAKQMSDDLAARDMADRAEDSVAAMTPEQRKEALKQWHG